MFDMIIEEIMKLPVPGGYSVMIYLWFTTVSLVFDTKIKRLRKRVDNLEVVVRRLKNKKG